MRASAGQRSYAEGRREGPTRVAMENITASRVAAKVWKDVRPLFYLETPSTSSFQRVTDVPDYVGQVIPYFFALIFLEVGIRWYKGMPQVRFNDSINSLTAGLLLLLTELLLGSVDISIYVWFHTHLCVYELPWDSPLTWVVAFLGVDCGYYWIHRISHEVNLAWAAHQAHHSSEDYTLFTALRQSTMQRFTSMFLYLPLALFLPPSAYFAHTQLNMLYQFWIHTEVIDRLGPLEWVLNTPSHHRVHHGRNPYCIDCNYAGVLIIWDRMFGTFQPELCEEKVIYGLVHPLSTWNPLWAQIHHYVYMWKRLWTEKGGWSFRLQFLFKGPGWSPGKPRLGLRKDIPRVSPDEKPYDTAVPMWLKFYVAIHFTIIAILSIALEEVHRSLHWVVTVSIIAFFIYSMTSLGLFLDCNPRSVSMEIPRLALLLIGLFQTSTLLSGVASVSVVLSCPVVLRFLVAASLVLWVTKTILGYTGSHKLSKED